jgi:mannose-6-phosphate isomerase-like protein (cupin superfamily)
VQQFFYVLRGEATLNVNGQVLLLRENEGAWVPPGTPHRIQNLSKSELQFLVTSEPPSHGDREEATC